MSTQPLTKENHMSEANVTMVEESRMFGGRPNIDTHVQAQDIFNEGDHVDVWVNGGNAFKVGVDSKDQIDEVATKKKLEELADEVSSAVAEAIRTHVEKCLVFK